MTHLDELELSPATFKPAPLTPRQRELLEKRWESAAETLLNRDGDNPKFPNGGHRVKSDPLLTAAITELRDQYFELYNEQVQILKMQEKARNADPTNKDWDQMVIDNRYDLIAFNHDAFKRLQQPDYGLDPEKAKAILARTPDPVADATHQLNKIDAAKITGTVIKRTINAFEVYFKPRVTVPHVPLTHGPETTSHYRSKPREATISPSWTERGARGRDESRTPDSSNTLV